MTVTFRDRLKIAYYTLQLLRGGTPMTRQEHDRQRALVALSTQLSDRRSERQQEAATIARLYPTTGRNVVALPQQPEPPRPAA